MIVTTGFEITGHEIAVYLGIVRGIVVRSPNIAQGIMGSLKSIVGGNIESFAQVCEKAREDAYERMVAHAQQLLADAVIGMRYDADQFAENATEVLCYGTAIKLAKR
ncbi:MAG: YbjQ family protein [Pirellulales bacterium]|nr:YbjQ family protein [Pirellulales bacterium]